MRSTLALLFGRSDRPIDRATYLRAGVSLMLLKYVVDAVLIGVFGGVFWTPVDYLLPMISFNAEKMAGFPLALNIALLVWALPFIWIGVSLSVRRAIDAGIFPGVVVTFFLPFLNYLLMAALALAPSRAREPGSSTGRCQSRNRRRGIGRSGGVGVLAGARDRPDRCRGRRGAAEDLRRQHLPRHAISHRARQRVRRQPDGGQDPRQRRSPSGSWRCWRRAGR